MTSRIVFFGTAEFSLATLEALINDHRQVVAVVTKPDSVSGRGGKIAAPAVKQLALQHGIKVLQPISLDADFIDQLDELQPDIGVVVSYGKIVPQTVIDAFPKGLINVHASLLPKYRGASPIEAAILNGDDKTGVSIMQINAGLDSGPVYTTAEIKLNGDETAPELYDSLAKLGASALIENLDAILDGTLIASAQIDTGMSLAPKIKKTDGVIDWKKSATTIERQIRAYIDWPGSQTNLYNRNLIITKATPDSALQLPVSPGELSIEDQKLIVATGAGILRIDRLKPVGKKEMSTSEFIRGLR
jgi:methionyl-tRNA formyltransferase